MRIGVLLLPTDPWTDAVRQAQSLEQAGFDHLWVYDHMTWRRYRERPWFSAMAWLAGIAGATNSIRLGTMVANPNIHHPLNLATDAVAIDHMSNGRLTLGIGAGGLGHDATVFGGPELTPGERIDRLTGYVYLFDRLMTGEEVSFRGQFYQLMDALVLPTPLQVPRIPIAIAAGQARGIELAARNGDGWITWGDTTLTDLSASGTDAIVARQMKMFVEACERAGRDVNDLDRIFLIGNTEARPLASTDEFADFVGRYRDLGFTDIVLHHPRPDDPVWNEPLDIVDHIADTLDALHQL